MPKTQVKLKRKGPKPKTIVKNARQTGVAGVTPILADHLALRDEATRGWSTRNKGKFRYKALYIGRTTTPLRFQITHTAPLARRARITVYRMVSEGTKVRHALMRDPYFPKTRPNRRGQWGSGGTVAKVSRDIRLPGVKARNFETLINKELQPDFTKLLGNNYGRQYFIRRK